jgi:hypothetical protein
MPSFAVARNRARRVIQVDQRGGGGRPARVKRLLLVPVHAASSSTAVDRACNARQVLAEVEYILAAFFCNLIIKVVSKIAASACRRYTRHAATTAHRHISPNMQAYTMRSMKAL